MFCMNLDLIDRLKKKMAMMRKTTTLKLMAAALASIFICSAQSCKDSGRENINAYYPNESQIRTPAEMKDAVRFDHVCTKEDMGEMVFKLLGI